MWLSEYGREDGQREARALRTEALPHVDALYRAALRLSRNPDDARDLLQETLLRAYRYFHQYTPGTNCRAWLLTILYNNFRNGYRGAGREQLSATPEDFERELEKFSSRGDQALSNPEMLVSEQIPDHEVSAALDALPPDFRAVLMLVDVQELNYKEVAQVLGIPIGTVKSRVSRGRQMMPYCAGRVCPPAGAGPIGGFRYRSVSVDRPRRFSAKLASARKTARLRRSCLLATPHRGHFLECFGTSVFQTHRIDELLRHL
jgi:RNA polymerase sigma-70 factor, ECF subfamily